MAIAAAVSAAELNAQVNALYVDKYYEARLIYAPGTSYQPGVTVDATFLGFEVTPGTAGYERQIIKYSSGDVGAYADDGVGLATKATTFAHDGGGATLDFSHVALVASTGNVNTIKAYTVQPTTVAEGTYLNLPTSTSGSGVGLTLNLTVVGIASTLTVGRPGYGYAADDEITISEADLVAVGACAPGAGGFTTEVFNVSTSTGRILAVAQTANTVQLSAGNEAAFYWNLKQYSFTS
ncbi:MAG: hypothetical protein ACO3HF_00955 [Burkholderiaceae bacterium]